MSLQENPKKIRKRKQLKGEDIAFKLLFYFGIGCGIIFRVILFLQDKLTVDERFTYDLLLLHGEDFWQVVVNDVHPPLYYLIAKLLWSIYPSLILIRAYALLLNEGSIILFYLLAKRLTGSTRKTQIATIYFALNTNFIFYGGLMRMYSQLLFFSLVTFYLYVKIMNYNEYEETIKKSTFWLMGIMSTFLLFSHYLAITLLFFYGFNAILLYFHRKKNKSPYASKKTIYNLILSMLPSLILYSIWIMNRLIGYYEILFIYGGTWESLSKDIPLSTYIDHLMNFVSALWPTNPTMMDFRKKLSRLYIIIFVLYLIIKIKEKTQTFTLEDEEFILLVITWVFYWCIVLIAFFIWGSTYSIAHVQRYFIYVFFIFPLVMGDALSIKQQRDIKDKQNRLRFHVLQDTNKYTFLILLINIILFFLQASQFYFLYTNYYIGGRIVDN